MLYIFDIDGTIAERDTLEILPGVIKWFKALDWERNQVAFATNQGGVGLRYWMEIDGFGEPEKYPTEAEAIRRVSAIEQDLVPPTQELRSEIYIAFVYQSKSSRKWGPVPNDLPRWSQEWRKPQAGMLLQAMRDAGASAAETVMVGDSEDDENAARVAGVQFFWAKEFFGE